MKKVTFNINDIKRLIGYVDTLLGFIDVYDIEDEENRNLVINGYDDFVEPIMKIVETELYN